MCENKIVKKVTFTGSTMVAKLLYKMAASTLKKFVFCSTSIFFFRLSKSLNLCVEYLWKLVATLLSLFSQTPTLTRPSRVRDRVLLRGLQIRLCYSIQLLLFANSELAGKPASVLTVSTSTLPFTLSLLLDLPTRLPNSNSAMVWRKECELKNPNYQITNF
jgi:hypothetical protein